MWGNSAKISGVRKCTKLFRNKIQSKEEASYSWVKRIHLVFNKIENEHSLFVKMSLKLKFVHRKFCGSKTLKQ